MSVQSKREELLNAWSHGVGALLGVIGLIALIVNVDSSKPWYLFSSNSNQTIRMNGVQIDL